MIYENVIIIPTYNEKENVKTLIPLIFELLPDIKVIIADDNSPDNTSTTVIKLIKKYPNLSLVSKKQKEGLGKAYINVFLQILKDINIQNVIIMDADLSHNPSFLPEMFKKKKEFGVIIGSRYVANGKIVGWKLWRQILSYLGNFYCRIITNMPIYDCTGGFNIISANFLKKIDFSKIDASGYAFEVELKYLLYKAGATFFEVPITFADRIHGKSKISLNIILEGVIAPWKMIFKK